jgi:hypothetical protein
MKVLMNICYGGFGFSPEFEEYFYSLHPDLQEEGNCLDYSMSFDTRTDVRIIEAIEAFGLDKASGSYAKLHIEEFPDGLEYSISEYDGVESIRTYLPITVDELSNGLSSERLELAKKADSLYLIKEGE